MANYNMTDEMYDLAKDEIDVVCNLVENISISIGNIYKGVGVGALDLNLAKKCIKGDIKTARAVLFQINKLLDSLDGENGEK